MVVALACFLPGLTTPIAALWGVPPNDASVERAFLPADSESGTITEDGRRGDRPYWMRQTGPPRMYALDVNAVRVLQPLRRRTRSLIGVGPMEKASRILRSR